MQFFNDLKSRNKLIISFGLIIILFLITVGVGYLGQKSLTEKMESMFNENYIASVGLSSLSSDFNAVRATLISMSHTTEKVLLERQKQTVKDITKSIDSGLGDLINDKKMPDEMIERFKAIKTPWEAFKETRDSEIIPAIIAGDLVKAKRIAQGVNSARYKKFTTLTDEMLKEEIAEARNTYVTSRQEADNSTFIFAALAITSIAFAFIFGALLIRSIIVPINSVVEMLKDIAEGEGDLTKRINVDSKDELGDMAKWFNKFIENLQVIIGNIAKTSHTLVSASNQMAEASNNIASGTEEQNLRSSQVATASQEMSATVIEVAENASGASEAAKEANTAAAKGGDIVSKTIQSMNGISDTAKESSEVISNLGARSKEIGNIVKVIDDIADQTNLLALNAAIEAARAGEQGRGFAVVADEVRTLAEKTTKATKEIGDMIKGMQDDTGRAVETMENEVRVVEEGVQFAKEAGASLQEIVGDVEKVNMMIDQIATASEEQSSTADQISSDIDTVAEIAKSNADGVTNITNAGNKLEELAGNLQEMVGAFKIK